jgi:outer membrane immunogenic protein
VSNFSGNPSGIAGGGQIGYNWQVGQFVFGAETDIEASAADDTFAPWQFSNPWFGTLRGRAGYAMNNILFYATAGLAYGNLTANLVGLEESKTLVGWTGGLGMEVGFTPNWAAKVEYLYMDLGSRFYSVTGVDNGLQSSYLRLGVNLLSQVANMRHKNPGYFIRGFSFFERSTYPRIARIFRRTSHSSRKQMSAHRATELAGRANTARDAINR